MKSINPYPVMYLQRKRKLSSETTQVSFITVLIFRFQVTLLMLL